MESTKSLPKTVADDVMRSLNRIADLVAKAGEDDGEDEEDEMDEVWNEDGYPNDDWGDDDDANERNDVNMVMELIGGNLPEPTSHSPDGTALLSMAQLGEAERQAYQKDELSHSSPQKGEGKIAKGRKVRADRLIKGAAPSRRKRSEGAKEDNGGLFIDGS